MTSQAKRLRQRARYSSADSPIIAVVIALAREYHCIVIESQSGITVKHKGRILWLGTVDDVKSLPLRSLISMFDMITQDWRYEVISK